MSRMRTLGMVGTAAIACSLFWGLARAAPQAGPSVKPPMRIAVVDPFSGGFAAEGNWSLKNVEFNANLINKEGGIAGHRIEIVPFDNKLSVQETLIQTQRAISEGIRYIAQNASDTNGFAVLSAVTKHNERDPSDPVVYLNYGAINNQFTNNKCNFYSFLFDADVSMKMNALTDWIQKQKNIHKIYLFDQNYVFGRSVAKNALEMLKQKRPDIKIVGDTFIPLAKVKDFTPYVTKIAASGADAVITGNWGADMSLFVKAAANAGLKIPILSYYGGLVGTVTAVGKAGVGRIYNVWGESEQMDSHGQFGAYQDEMYAKTHYDHSDIRSWYMFQMLQKAGQVAQSINPTKLAFALEGVKLDGPYGPVWMRSSDHQIQEPLVISVLEDGMKYGLEGTHMNFKGIDTIPAKDIELPTSCRMKRPARS